MDAMANRQKIASEFEAASRTRQYLHRGGKNLQLKNLAGKYLRPALSDASRHENPSANGWHRSCIGGVHEIRDEKDSVV
jgi:hypothetical protein